MPLIPQQDIVVIAGPYEVARGGTFQAAAADKLKSVLEGYPPCRVIAISLDGVMAGTVLTAVIETV